MLVYVFYIIVSICLFLCAREKRSPFFFSNNTQIFKVEESNVAHGLSVSIQTLVLCTKMQYNFDVIIEA